MLSKLSQYEFDFEENINMDMLLNLGNTAEMDMQDLDINWSDLDQELIAVLNMGQYTDSTEAEAQQPFVYEDTLETGEIDVEELFNQLSQPMTSTFKQPQTTSDIEHELAALDGAGVPTAPEPQPMALLGQVCGNWSVVEPLSTSSSVLISCLCFGRLVGNEVKIYDVLQIFGYEHWGTPKLLDRSGKRAEHIFPYAELPEHIRQMITLETGSSVIDLLNMSDRHSDCTAEEHEILCVSSIASIVVTFNSSVVPPSEKHSGFNVFGEATRISLTIHNTEIVLDNETIVALTSLPDNNVFLFSTISNIYVLSGRLLYERTELARHVRPISNIELMSNSAFDVTAGRFGNA